MKYINIAIDGPAGAGKSSVSKRIAKELSYIYLDTGALYRAIGIYALRNGADTTSDKLITPLLKDISLTLKHVDGIQRIFLNGEDISEIIRKSDASMAASNVSAIPSVRAFLLDIQKNIAKENNLIMDGRDIGTIILPHAQIKIFLTATPEERARRRYEEMTLKGQNVDYKVLLKEIKERDFNDSTREISPLKPADDAIIVDNTGFVFEQSVEALLGLIRSRLNDL